MGPPENLLYLLVICPGLSADSRGTATDYGQRSNAYSSEWTTSKGEVSVTVKWDKRADKVIIGKQQFIVTQEALSSSYAIQMESWFPHS